MTSTDTPAKRYGITLAGGGELPGEIRTAGFQVAALTLAEAEEMAENIRLALNTRAYDGLYVDSVIELA